MIIRRSHYVLNCIGNLDFCLVSASKMVKTLRIHNTELKLYFCGIMERLEISEFYLRCNGDAENHKIKLRRKVRKHKTK